SEGQARLDAGFARADVSARPGGRPFVLATPHAELRLTDARCAVSSAGGETRGGGHAGRGGLLRGADGPVEVESGCYVEVPAHKAPVVRALSAQLTRPRLELKTTGVALSFLPDRPLLACADARQVTFWDPLTGKRHFTLPGGKE